MIYTIIQQMDSSAFKLDIPPQLGIHDLVNVSQLNHMSHLIWRNQFQSHIKRSQFQTFILLFLKIPFLISAPDSLGSVKSPLTWWDENALRPLRLSDCHSQLMRPSVVNMYYSCTLSILYSSTLVLYLLSFWVTRSKLITHLLYCILLETWSKMITPLVLYPYI